MQSKDIISNIIKTLKVDTLVKKSDSMILNKKFSFVIIIFLIIYIGLILPHLFKLDDYLYKTIIRIFKDPVYKVIMLLLIGYISYVDFILAVYLVLAYSMTLDSITKYELAIQQKRNIIYIQKKSEIKFDVIKEDNQNISKPNNYNKNELFNELIDKY